MVNVLDLAARGIGEGGDFFVSASRSSGSKLPRHRFFLYNRSSPTTGFSLLQVLLYHRGSSLFPGSSFPWGWLWGTASRPSGDKSPRHKGGIDSFTTKGSGDISPHHKSAWGIG
jgi:hypothetical protein